LTWRSLRVSHFIQWSSPNLRFFSTETAKSMIGEVIKSHPLVIFIKGSREQPMVSMIDVFFDVYY
jgi:hypothetical protein